MTDKELQDELLAINSMTRYAVCALWRFAPAGHPYFVRDTILEKAFSKRFKELGGFSPEISKQLGW